MPRLYDMDVVTSIRQLKSHLVTKFVTIRGTVVRVGNLKPMVSQMNFRCSRCDIVMSCFFEDGRFKNPEKCKSDCNDLIREIEGRSEIANAIAKIIDLDKLIHVDNPPSYEEVEVEKLFLEEREKSREKILNHLDKICSNSPPYSFSG